MDIDENLHRPEESGSADVTLLARGVTVTASVEESSTGLVIVRPDPSRPQDEIQTGDRVELYWVGGNEERTLGGEVSSIEVGPEPRWHIAVSGMAERSQRRKAVRARVVVPVEAGYMSYELTGKSVDLSEAGMRATIEGFGLPPEPGSTMDMVIKLETGEVKAKAEVIRNQARGAQWLLSLRFLDLEERDGDKLRRRVFQALREERARATD
jgi:hypothetical protein